MSRHLGYIAIEGAIGAGKAALAKALAPRLNARLVLEAPSANPFLDNFYDDRPRWALHTQLAFLLARHQALARRETHHGVGHLGRRRQRRLARRAGRRRWAPQQHSLHHQRRRTRRKIEPRQ